MTLGKTDAKFELAEENRPPRLTNPKVQASWVARAQGERVLSYFAEGNFVPTCDCTRFTSMPVDGSAGCHLRERLPLGCR
jgi:hypothetical protein